MSLTSTYVYNTTLIGNNEQVAVHYVSVPLKNHIWTCLNCINCLNCFKINQIAHSFSPLGSHCNQQKSVLSFFIMTIQKLHLTFVSLPQLTRQMSRLSFPIWILLQHIQHISIGSFKSWLLEFVSPIIWRTCCRNKPNQTQS